MKNFILMFIGSLIALPVYANTQFCGNVTITTILTGPRHGAMMHVSGQCGWVCLDPEGEHMSKSQSERLFSHVLTAHSQKKTIELHVYQNKRAAACGGYPVVEDLRTH